MAEFIKDFQEVAHVPRNPVESGDEDDIEAMPAGI